MEDTESGTIIISSLAKDLFLNKNRLVKTKIGGPAFWMAKTFKTLNVPCGIILAKPDAVVKIHLPEESGEIISVGRLRVRKNISAPGIIISTIGSEFDLCDLNKLNGVIALDVQGFVRHLHSGRKLTLPVKLSDKIQVLKATENELKRVSDRLIRSQRDRILIITRGAKGFDVVSNNRTHSFRASKIEPPDAIGAGDVLLASFMIEFIRGQDSIRAGKFALGCITSFLMAKK